MVFVCTSLAQILLKIPFEAKIRHFFIPDKLTLHHISDTPTSLPGLNVTDIVGTQEEDSPPTQKTKQNKKKNNKINISFLLSAVYGPFFPVDTCHSREAECLPE